MLGAFVVIGCVWASFDTQKPTQKTVRRYKRVQKTWWLAAISQSSREIEGSGWWVGELVVPSRLCNVPHFPSSTAQHQRSNSFTNPSDVIGISSKLFSCCASPRCLLSMAVQNVKSISAQWEHHRLGSCLWIRAVYGTFLLPCRAS